LTKIVQLTVPVRFIFDHPSYTIQLKNLKDFNLLPAGTETYEPLQVVQNQISMHMRTVLPGSKHVELYSYIENPLTSNRLF
jgi:hypothetical protein